MDFIVKEQKPKCEMAEEILAVPPCKKNFGHGTIFPLPAGLYLYVVLQECDFFFSKQIEEYQLVI